MEISWTHKTHHDFPIQENQGLLIYQQHILCTFEGRVVDVHDPLGVHQLEVDLHLLYLRKISSS
jgi:hypothetical protein